MSGVLRGLTVGLALSATSSIGAQSPARPVQPTAVQLQARQQIAAFEGTLEIAVRQGA